MTRGSGDALGRERDLVHEGDELVVDAVAVVLVEDVVQVAGEDPEGAQRSEPDIDAAYQEGRRRGREGQSRMFGSWPADVLREGVTPERASDIFAALCNVDVYRVLTEEWGWTPDQVEEWWREALTGLLLS